MNTKTKKTALDVDFMGGHGSLTPIEEKSLSDYFKKRKLASKKTVADKKLKTAKRSNMSA